MYVLFIHLSNSSRSTRLQEQGLFLGRAMLLSSTSCSPFLFSSLSILFLLLIFVLHQSVLHQSVLLRQLQLSVIHLFCHFDIWTALKTSSVFQLSLSIFPSLSILLYHLPICVFVSLHFNDSEESLCHVYSLTSFSPFPLPPSLLLSLFLVSVPFPCSWGAFQKKLMKNGL